jgi:hypothetical protein
VSNTLHRLLVEHVYLVGMLARTIQDGREEQLQAAIDAVDANSRALADLVGETQGPDVREAFLRAWRGQIGLYIDYAFGAATGDDEKKRTALASLNDARGNIDSALTSANPRLHAGDAAEMLRPQVQHIVDSINTLAAGDSTGAYAALQAAANGVPGVADPLAEALAPRSAQPIAAPQPTPAPAARPEGAGVPAQPVSPSPASQSSAGCTVSGPAERYVTTLAEFGLGGESFIKQRDPTYWGGNGYLIGFERGEGDAFQSSPWGGYLIAGVILTSDERVAGQALRGTVRGWTDDWHPYEVRPLPSLGDEATVVARLTPWEITNAQPMSEVFLAARHCNAVTHVLLAVMPDLDPVVQAERYVRLMLDRIGP